MPTSPILGVVPIGNSTAAETPDYVGRIREILLMLNYVNVKNNVVPQSQSIKLWNKVINS